MIDILVVVIICWTLWQAWKHEYIVIERKFTGLTIHIRWIKEKKNDY